MKKIKILGYSGHSFEIIEILKSDNFKIEGYYELEKKEYNPFSLKYLGGERDYPFENLVYGNNFFVAIGDNSIRKRLSDLIIKKGGILVNAIHHTSSISSQVKLGTGNFISKNTCINFNTILKDNIIINTSSVIEHDCVIESGVHIGPGAIVCGGVKVKKGAFIGANSVVKENILIGENALIGAGSVVIKDIPDNSKAYGNPSKIKK